MFTVTKWLNPCWGARLWCKKPANSLDSIWQWKYVTHSQREQAGCVWLLWISCHPEYHCYCIIGWRQLLWGIGAKPTLESCILEHYFWVALFWRLSRKHKRTPRRGIEPRSSAWQAEILATILTRTASLQNSAISKQRGRCSDFYYIVLFLLGGWWQIFCCTGFLLQLTGFWKGLRTYIGNFVFSQFAKVSNMLRVYHTWDESWSQLGL